nr:hypothetical protein [Tanacetum cinerariifolium]
MEETQSKLIAESAKRHDENSNLIKEIWASMDATIKNQGATIKVDGGNPPYQERRQTMEEILSEFMAESAKRHDENFNLIKEIRAATNVAIKNQGASIKALEI